MQQSILWLFLALILFPFNLKALSINLPPKISLQVAQEIPVEGRPITLYIIVDHSEKDSIDPSSFQMDEKPLSVEQIQEQKVTPEALAKGEDEESQLIVTTYRTILPPKPSGIYSVGPVSAVVGGMPFSSNEITIQVQGAVASKDFRLEMAVQSPPKIFPGQTVVFEYRIFFTGSMQLLREDLPLLNSPGFLNIGAPEITTEATSGGSIQTIKQRATALNPGPYEVGISTIEGMTIDTSGGTPRPVPPLYRAQASSMSMVITPFPEAGKPAFFSGALGNFVWRSRSLSGTGATIGEPVQIEYIVSGTGELSTVRFPSFDQLPGLSDSFWTDANPPAGEEVDGTKRFVLALRPKRLGPVEIPGFFVTSFDPYSEQYVTQSVPPVKLNVEGSKETEQQLLKEGPVAAPTIKRPFDLDATTVTVYTPPQILIVIAFGVALVLALLQLAVHWYIQKGRQKQLTSRDLFYQAFINRSNQEKGLGLLRRGLYMRLFELGLTPTMLDAPDQIGSDGIAGEAKTLIQQIERQLYQGKATTSIPEMYQEASSLYYRMKNMRQA